MEAVVGETSPERRRARRSTAVEEHGIVSARVKPGRDVLVVNISAQGALLETFHRLLPGTAVDLQLDRSARRIVIRGRVIRCSVVAVHAAAVVYHGAIAFDRPMAWLGEPTLDGNEVPIQQEVLTSPGCAPVTQETVCG